MTSDRWAKEDFVTAAIAAAAGSYQPVDSDLTAIAALTTTSYGRAFLVLADAAAGRTALGLGTAAIHATGDFDAAGAAAAAQAASQPLDSDLTAIAALTTTSFGRALLALADAAALRTAAGLGAAALLADPITAAHGGTGLTSLTAHALQVGNGTSNAVQLGPDASTTKILQAAGSSADPAFVALSGDATIAAGGAVTLKNTGPGATGPLGTAARTNTVTIDAQGRVTALSDQAIAIPESAVTSLVSDLALKAPLASPALTGTPTAPTQTAGDSSTAIATDAFVTTAVNNALSGLDVKPDVAYAATSALPACTYANGSSGVGATLTGNANGPLLVDGVTILLAQAGQRVLIAAQAAPEQNGWYTITQVGVVAVSPFILTRATDSDQAAEIGAGYLTGVVAPNGVTAGSNNGKLYISVAADPFVVGTTSLTFSQVGGTYTNGTGISLSGSTFSIDTAVTVDKTTAQTLTNKTIDGSQLVAASVALAKIATQADQTILGNNSGGTAVPSALTASQVRTLLGLVIGTNVQAYDADLTTYAGITPGALGQAILPMTTLTNHGLVLGGGASAPTALAPDSGTTKFLKNTVASDAPTWQTIAESDVTNLATDLTALQTQTALQAAQLSATLLADAGQFVCSGCLLSPNATPTKLDMAVGVAFMATVQLIVAAQTAISTTIASLADATNPKWVVVELDSSNVVQFNQGTAAAAPAFPALTTTRTPLGFIFVPANATNVDTLLTTNNGLAKLIDARVLRLVQTGVDVQYFTGAGAYTWTKPANAVLVEVVTVGAGGGGGSGRQGAASSDRFGGGGGASGNYSTQRLRAASITGTVTVTVGAGGNGGAGASTSGTIAADGAVGTAGTASTFGAYCAAGGGSGGLGGTNALGTGGATNTTRGQLVQGGVSTLGTGAGLNGVNGTGTGGAVSEGGGGGGGGGIPVANTASAGGKGCLGSTGWDAANVAGGLGGTIASPTTTGTGGDGQPGAAAGDFTGSGGGGAASGGTTSGAAGTGGAGAQTAGGGGGGAATTGSHAGVGGKGGDGIVMVITHRA